MLWALVVAISNDWLLRSHEKDILGLIEGSYVEQISTVMATMASSCECNEREIW